MKYDLQVRDSYGHLLEVIQELPEKGNKFPTILLVSGFGMDLHEYGFFDKLSQYLVKHGFGTIRFSFEGCGRSEGDFLSMTIDAQAQQVKDILKYVKKDRFSQKRKIGICAQSFGGATVIAGMPVTGVKSYLFTSTPAYPYESLSRWFKRQRGFRPDGISEIERSDKRKTRIGPQFWKNLVTHDLPQEISRLTQPVQFIYGSRDDRVKIWEGEEYYNRVRGSKKLQVIELADHAFTGKFRLKVFELITDWFSNTLNENQR